MKKDKGVIGINVPNRKEFTILGTDEKALSAFHESLVELIKKYGLPEFKFVACGMKRVGGLHASNWSFQQRK